MIKRSLLNDKEFFFFIISFLNEYLFSKNFIFLIADFIIKMAPTIYLSEIPVVRTSTIPCSRRRQRIHNGAVAKQQRLEIRRLETNESSRDNGSLTPPENSLWEPENSNDSCDPTIVSSSFPNVSARVPVDTKEHWKVFLARRKGVVFNTIK